MLDKMSGGAERGRALKRVRVPPFSSYGNAIVLVAAFPLKTTFIAFKIVSAEPAEIPSVLFVNVTFSSEIGEFVYASAF